MKKHSKTLVLIIGTILFCVIPMVIKLPIRLTYNPSPSAPVGFYIVDTDGELKLGTYVVVPTPVTYRKMAAERHYLPFNVPLIKRVVALSGDQICRHGEVVFINNEPVVTALRVDSQGRSLPIWQGCLTLNEDQFFALMDAPDSFDGRYFGPLNRNDVVGTVEPIFMK